MSGGPREHRSARLRCGNHSRHVACLLAVSTLPFLPACNARLPVEMREPPSAFAEDEEFEEAWVGAVDSEASGPAPAFTEPTVSAELPALPAVPPGEVPAPWHDATPAECVGLWCSVRVGGTLSVASSYLVAFDPDGRASFCVITARAPTGTTMQLLSGPWTVEARGLVLDPDLPPFRVRTREGRLLLENEQSVLELERVGSAIPPPPSS